MVGLVVANQHLHIPTFLGILALIIIFLVWEFLLGNLLQLVHLAKDIAQLPGWRQQHFSAGVFNPVLLLQLPGSCRVSPPCRDVLGPAPGGVQGPALPSPCRHQALPPAGSCILDQCLSLELHTDLPELKFRLLWA